MTTPNNDLSSLISAAVGTSDKPKTTAQRGPTADRATATHAGSDDLQALIARSHYGLATSVAEGTSPGSSLTDVQGALDLAIRKAPAQELVSASAGMRSRAVMFALALLLMLSAVAWSWHGRHPSLTGPPATLRDLAQGIERYRSQHSGSLPGQLSNLEQFPKTAVEWQLRHWKARDAAGRTEILWAPNGPKHYRIVLRHGSQVWVYNDIDGQSKQTNK